MNSASWVSWCLELTTGGDRKALIRFRLFNTHSSVSMCVIQTHCGACSGAGVRRLPVLGLPVCSGAFFPCTFHLCSSSAEATGFIYGLKRKVETTVSKSSGKLLVVSFPSSRVMAAALAQGSALAMLEQAIANYHCLIIVCNGDSGSSRKASYPSRAISQ